MTSSVRVLFPSASVPQIAFPLGRWMLLRLVCVLVCKAYMSLRRQRGCCAISGGKDC